MQAWTAEQGTAKAIIGKSGAQRGSKSTRAARKSAPFHMTAVSARDMEREMTSPVRKTFRPFPTSAATKREMAVWMDPAQRAKQMPKMGWTML